MALAQVGKVYCFGIFGGGYGAAQVVAEKGLGKKRRVLLLGLNIDSAVPPDLASVSAAAPLSVFLPKDGYLWAIDDVVPWWAQEIGDLPVGQPPFTQTGYMGTWESIRHNARLARRYARGAPKPNPNWWRVELPQVRVDIGGAPGNFKQLTSHLDARELLPPRTQAVNWNGLQALPNLTSLVHSGIDHGLVAAIPDVPVLERLTWHAPAERMIDLRHTRLTDVSLVDVDHCVEIWLPEGCAHLGIEGRYDLATIHAPDTGEGFDLWLKGPFNGLPHGIETVQEVTLVVGRHLDLAAFATWPELKSLRIVGTATSLDNVAALRELKQLRNLEGRELYRIDVQGFPTDLPMHSITIDGLRADDAKILRKRLKHIPHVAFSKTRSDKWIAEYFDNPFRNWDADGPAFGKAAMKLWQEAVHTAHAIDGMASIEKVRTTVLALVAGLNKLNKRYDIDTLRREQACEAIAALVQDHLGGALDAEQTQAVIDEARDW